jgi:hypothetical protein
MAGQYRYTRAFALTLLLLACIPALAADVKPAAPEPYAPGLGDFMTAYVQPHHIKLWFAGSAGNWMLAAYEASELGETFEDVTTYQAVWKSVPVARLVKSIMDPALRKLNAAIAARDPAAFKSAFTALTAGCNACHASAQHAFLQVIVPATNPYSDQEFAAH